MTKQSEAVIAFKIGQDPGQEQRRPPLWTGWTKEFRTHRKQMDDPVRHERLAAIGRMGHRFAFRKRMTFYFVNLSDWKRKCIEPEMTQFSPIIKCGVIVVTL